MTLPFDIENYHKVFSKYPKCLMESEGKLYGWWYEGNQFKRKEGYHGQYPPSYLKRVKALFPNHTRVLHLFGGVVIPSKNEITFDINPNLHPTICGKAEELGIHFERNSFDAIYADTPYDAKNAKIYGYPLPNKRLVLRECRKIIKEDGVLLWMDIMIPIFRKIEWNLMGTIGIFNSTNHVIRVVAILQASKDEIYDKATNDERM
jgi:SAM-dependent methyltransferase